MEPTIQIKLLETDEGKVPFEEWYDSLKDKVTKVRVRRRLDRLELGNLGDTQPVGRAFMNCGFISVLGIESISLVWETLSLFC